MKNKFLIAIVFSLLTFFLSPVVSSSKAQISCQPIYGGGQTCVASENLTIDKKVINPESNTLVDNLSVNDLKHAPSDVVNFRLEVSNTGDENITRIEIKDVFPQFVEFVSGPGSFDANSKTLTFVLANLAPEETRAFEIVGKVVNVDQISINQNTVCLVNQATATANNGTISSDNSQFCIDKDIRPATTMGGFPILSPVPVTSTPSTGPQGLVLFSMIPLGATGFLLRKYTIKKEVKN